jgi:hypothetical protein
MRTVTFGRTGLESRRSASAPGRSAGATGVGGWGERDDDGVGFCDPARAELGISWVDRGPVRVGAREGRQPRGRRREPPR